MDKWEYKIETLGIWSMFSEVETLNQFGQNGWELISVKDEAFARVLYLKRKLSLNPSAPKKASSKPKKANKKS